MSGLLAIALSSMLLAGSAPPAQRPSPLQQGRAAWEALNAGRTREAAQAFAEALRERPRDPLLLLGAGAAAHQLGQPDVARRFLLDALRYDPTLTPASMLLGEILYIAGDLPGAIATYEQAIAHMPGHAQLQARLERWRNELSLHDRFSQRLGDHFTVLFEGPAEADLARRAVEILEAAYWRIGTALGVYPADVITVVLYTREQFRDITQSPAWAGGAFDGRIRVPVQGALANPRVFERVLTHEFVHALVRSVAPRGVPQWLNEGLAIYFEGRAARPREAPPELVTAPPLSELEGPFGALDNEQAGLAYAQSAAAVARLIDEAGTAAIIGILEDVARGRAFAEAFERHANVSYRDFQQKLAGK